MHSTLSIMLRVKLGSSLCFTTYFSHRGFLSNTTAQNTAPITALVKTLHDTAVTAVFPATPSHYCSFCSIPAFNTGPNTTRAVSLTVSAAIIYWSTFPTAVLTAVLTPISTIVAITAQTAFLFCYTKVSLAYLHNGSDLCFHVNVIKSY